MPWIRRWSQRLDEVMKSERDRFAAFGAAFNVEAPPILGDPRTPINRELSCQALEESPMPYVLNVGCGFFPTSLGFRRNDGVAVNIVGVDPLAYPIADAYGVIEKAAPVKHMRRFIAPIVCEEMNNLFPPGVFHAVWSEDTFLDCCDPFRFLQQCVRATKQGGVVCVKFKRDSPGSLWTVMGHDGGMIMLDAGEHGSVKLSEVRGERVEVHELLDGSLMVKLRRREHDEQQAGRILRALTLPKS